MSAPRGLHDIIIGIDVQTTRGCAYYATTADGRYLDSGWLSGDRAAAQEAVAIVARLTGGAPSHAAVGIDAPRCPLPSPRPWTWSGKAKRWQPAHAVVVGRHCEVVISALGLANPQWTPLTGTAPAWMETGFALFAALTDAGATTYEVFPSAAYRQLNAATDATMSINLVHFAGGPKDMLDAAVGAMVVRAYEASVGCAVGGGDGYGTIILPRPVHDARSPVHDWPSANSASCAVVPA